VLVVYSTHGREQIEPVMARFATAHPEIAVEWRPYSTGDLYNAIKTERGQPQADVWWGGPHTTFTQAERDGLLAVYRPTWSEAVAAEHRSPGGYWFGTYLMPEGIMYNANVLREEEVPKDWDDLLDPKWKGRIVLREPGKSGTMRAIFGALVWRTYSASGDAAPGLDFLRKLHGNVAVYAPDPRAMYQMLNTPETPITVWNMVDAFVQSQQGYNFKFVAPSSGVPVLTEGIALIKNAPHRAEAEVFYEWVTSTEELIHQAHHFARIPARTDIARESLPAWITEQEYKPMEIDTERYLPLEQEWMDYFREQIQTSTP